MSAGFDDFGWKKVEIRRGDKVLDKVEHTAYWMIATGEESQSQGGGLERVSDFLFVSLLLEGPHPDLHHTHTHTHTHTHRKLICWAANRVSCGCGRTTGSRLKRFSILLSSPFNPLLSFLHSHPVVFSILSCPPLHRPPVWRFLALLAFLLSVFTSPLSFTLLHFHFLLSFFLPL